MHTYPMTALSPVEPPAGSRLAATAAAAAAAADQPQHPPHKPQQPQVHAELEEGELWQRFRELTNEMIVTKGGRRMFPIIKLRLSGLRPDAFYKVLLEFKQIDANRWKYINGEWLAGNLGLKL